MIMLVKFIVVILISTVCGDSYNVTEIQCEGRLCLYKFLLPYQSGRWQQSYDSCRNNDMDLLTIDNQAMESDVERLLKQQPDINVGTIWIAGRGTSDYKWRYMNGSEFKVDITIIQSTENDAHCLYALLDANGVYQYTSDQCYEKTSPSQLICQYDQSDTGHCKSGHLSYGGKCYMKTKYDGRNESHKIDWFSGQTYCNGLNSDIIYSNIKSVFQSHLKYFMNTDIRPQQVWIGVTRSHWYWDRGSSSGTVNTPIRYYNWDDKEGGDPYNRCIVIDHKNKDKWRSESCSSLIKYFICMKKPLPDTTTTKTSIGYLPTTESINTDRVTETISLPNVKKPNTVYIAVSIVAIILVAAAIGLTTFFVKRRKRRAATEHYTEDQDNPTSSTQSATGGPEYANIAFVPNEDGVTQEEAPSPYAEVGFGERFSNLLEKKRPKFAGKKRNGDEKNTKRAIKKTRHTKSSKHNDKETVHDDDSSPGEQPDESKPVMTYKQAPSGDLYAVVNKDDNREGKIKHIATEQGDLYAVSLNKS